MTGPLYSDDASAIGEWWRVGGVGAVGLATLGISLLAVESPTQCIWCEPNRFDLHVRETMEWKNRYAAGIGSDVIVLGVLPLLSVGAAAGMFHSSERFVLHVLSILDSVLLTFAITEIFKRSVARARPEFYASYPRMDTADVFMSFPSGHTSTAFALAGAASTIAFYEGVWWAPYVALIGACAGLSTAYLRVAAGKHWATDVLTGMAIGSAIGIGVPLFVLNYNRKQPIPNDEISWNISPMLDRAGLRLTMTW